MLGAACITFCAPHRYQDVNIEIIKHWNRSTQKGHNTLVDLMAVQCSSFYAALWKMFISVDIADRKKTHRTIDVCEELDNKAADQRNCVVPSPFATCWKYLEWFWIFDLKRFFNLEKISCLYFKVFYMINTNLWSKW